MAVKVSEQEIERIDRQRQHSELVEGLSTIAENLKEQNSNDKFTAILTEKFEGLKKSIESINLSPQINIPEQSSQEIINNVEVDLSKLSQEINSLKDNMNSIATAIENRPREWKFKVQRDNVGYINEVDALAK